MWPRTVQLPWSTTWQQLKEIFQEYNVKFADVKTGFDGRSRGYGIVRFDQEDEAYAALALNGYNLDGREILCAPARPTRGSASARASSDASRLDVAAPHPPLSRPPLCPSPPTPTPLRRLTRRRPAPPPQGAL